MNSTDQPDRTETLACLIIDDPLLRPRYGCLDYEELLRAMEKHRFFTEIAFIPFNWNRSEERTVRLFREHPEYFGLCVHGCDHTSSEFARGSEADLRERAQTALWRMERHRERTGLSYDPVMVFPRGEFSGAAMRALADAGYWAAFNSTLKTVDGGEVPVEEERKALSTLHHGFPLFLRRYPTNREGFRQDVANGRPLLVVEHHGYFRDGGRALTELVDWINGLGRVRWTSLGEITRSYLGAEAAGRSAPALPESAPHQSPVGVSVRRMLSEFRDSHVETNPLLTKLYHDLRQIVR